MIKQEQTKNTTTNTTFINFFLIMMICIVFVIICTITFAINPSLNYVKNTEVEKEETIRRFTLVANQDNNNDISLEIEKPSLENKENTDNDLDNNATIEDIQNINHKNFIIPILFMIVVIVEMVVIIVQRKKILESVEKLNKIKEESDKINIEKDILKTNE